MKHITSLILPVVAAATMVTGAFAATYSVEGEISSSPVASFPAGATYRFTFDYDSITVGADTEPALWAGRYENSLTNATLTIASFSGTTVYDLSTTRMMVVANSVDDQLFLEFFNMDPAVDGLDFTYGLVALYGAPDIWTSDAPPADPAALPWIGGELALEFEDSLGGYYPVTGTTDVQTFVPEPSVALLGMIGVFCLVRRRRA